MGGMSVDDFETLCCVFQIVARWVICFRNENAGWMEVFDFERFVVVVVVGARVEELVWCLEMQINHGSSWIMRR